MQCGDLKNIKNKAMKAKYNHGSAIMAAADLSVLDRILALADETYLIIRITGMS